MIRRTRSQSRKLSSTQWWLAVSAVITVACDGSDGAVNREISPPDGCSSEAVAEITSEETYEQWLDAAVAAEIVSESLAKDRRPRLAVSAALLVAFADRNRQSTRADLDRYAAAVDARLAVAYEDDAALRRPVHVLPAVRFAAEDLNEPGLVGFDVRVGEQALQLLELALDPTRRAERGADFQRVGDADFAYHRALTHLLQDSQLGRLPGGCGHPSLAAAMQSLMANHGVVITPVDLAARHPEIAAARAAMPDYAAFVAERNAGFSGLRAAIQQEMSAARARTDQTLAELVDALGQPVHVVNDHQPLIDAERLEALDRKRLDGIRQRAASRARLSLSAMLVAQSERRADIEYAEQVGRVSDAQLQTDDTVGREVTKLVGGAAVAGLAAYKADPIAAVGGLMVIVDGIFDLTGDAAPTPEEQIFEQIQAMQRQIDAFRGEMRVRFDSIDAQLDVLYRAMAAGLNEIDATTRRIEGDVQQLRGELFALRSSLSSLEANLYGVVVGGFHQSFVEDMETGLGHRRRTGADLAYTGAGDNTFFALHSRFYARATNAATSETYAGPATRDLINDETAADKLSSFPLGYRLNDLRQLPEDLGLPPVTRTRVANPTTWSVAADAYAQLARENPWYFANLHDNDPSRLNELIAVGEETERTMREMRDTVLFEALLDDYRRRVDALEQLIGIDDFLTDNGHPVALDPFGGLDQPTIGMGPQLPTVFDAAAGESGEQVATWFDRSLAWEQLYPELAIAYAARFFNWEDSDHVGRFEQRFYDHESGILPCGVPDDGAFQAANPLFIGLGLSDYEGEAVYLAGFEFDGAPPADVSDWLRDHGEVIDGLFRAAEPGQRIEASDGRTVVFSAGARFADCSHNEIPFYVPQDLRDHLDEIAARYGDRAVPHLSLAEPRSADVSLRLQRLASSRALLDAFVSLGMPETQAHDEVLRGLLRGDADVGAGRLYEDVVRAWDQRVRPPSIARTLNERAALLLERIRRAIQDQPTPEMHPYLEWSLQSLRYLRARAFDLCRPDRYVASTERTLRVDADRAVLANDAEQPGAVWLRAELVEGPQHGTLTFAEDGAFTYTPDRGFVGEDAFQYRATAQLDDTGGPMSEVSATPVRVVLDVR